MRLKGLAGAATLALLIGVFTWKDPKRIAASLKRSAEASRRGKAEPSVPLCPC